MNKVHEPWRHSPSIGGVQLSSFAKALCAVLLEGVASGAMDFTTLQPPPMHPPLPTRKDCSDLTHNFIQGHRHTIQKHG